MKTNLKQLSWLLLVYVFVLSGCRDKAEEPKPDEGNFVSATLIADLTKSNLQTYAVAFGLNANVSAYIRHDVSFFRLVYKTTYNGQETEASGLLAIPRGLTTAPPLLSAQHGTIFRNADAPSSFLSSLSSFSGFEILGAAGYITAIPDNIGLGTSAALVEPVYDKTHAALAVVDMLKATRFYLQRENIASSNKLFLLGYSQGGYTTMAAQQEIETNASHNLTLTAVAAGAGGYDLPLMLQQVATAPTYTSPAFLVKLVHSYNTTYNWNRPMSDYFQAPYAAAVPGLLDGTKGGEEINAALPFNPADLFNPVFYQNLQNPAGETALKQKMAENSFLNWVPQKPTRLYHGTQDETVFFQTSQSTYDRFSQAGAPNITLIPISGGTHITSIEPMMIDAIVWFETMK